MNSILIIPRAVFSNQCPHSNHEFYSLYLVDSYTVPVRNKYNKMQMKMIVMKIIGNKTI